jgi:sugar phosphate permease
LPVIGAKSTWLATASVGGIGLLSYGPYSLLAGVIAVEIRGREHVATVAGILDGVGYFAAILAGAAFGRMLDVGGYQLGFDCLAALALVAAVLCLFLYDRSPEMQPTRSAAGAVVTT